MKKDIEYLKDMIKILKAEPEGNPQAPIELSYMSQRELAIAIENVVNNLETMIKLNTELRELSIKKDKIRDYIKRLQDKSNEYKMKYTTLEELLKEE